MLPASCLLSPSQEDRRQKANISSSAAMLHAAAACLAPFSGEEEHMAEIEGKAEQSAGGCCFHAAATQTHTIQVYQDTSNTN